MLKCIIHSALDQYTCLYNENIEFNDDFEMTMITCLGKLSTYQNDMVKLYFNKMNTLIEYKGILKNINRKFI